MYTPELGTITVLKPETRWLTYNLPITFRSLRLSRPKIS